MAFHQKPSKTPSLSNLNHLGSSLHEAAANGDKKRVKQILKIGKLKIYISILKCRFLDFQDTKNIDLVLI